MAQEKGNYGKKLWRTDGKCSFHQKGLLAEGFEGKHIALIGTSSVEWMESYLGIITGCTTAVPLDAALPCEDLIDLLNRSDSVALS